MEKESSLPKKEQKWSVESDQRKLPHQHTSYRKSMNYLQMNTLKMSLSAAKNAIISNRTKSIPLKSKENTHPSNMSLKADPAVTKSPKINPNKKISYGSSILREFDQSLKENLEPKRSESIQSSNDEKSMSDTRSNPAKKDESAQDSSRFLKPFDEIQHKRHTNFDPNSFNQIRLDDSANSSLNKSDEKYQESATSSSKVHPKELNSRKSVSSLALQGSKPAVSQNTMINWVKHVEREKYAIEEKKLNDRIVGLKSTIDSMNLDMKKSYQEYNDQIAKERRKSQEQAAQMNQLKQELCEHKNLLTKYQNNYVPLNQYEALLNDRDQLIQSLKQAEEDVESALEELENAASKHSHEMASTCMDLESKLREKCHENEVAKKEADLQLEELHDKVVKLSFEAGEKDALNEDLRDKISEYTKVIDQYSEDNEDLLQQLKVVRDLLDELQRKEQLRASSMKSIATQTSIESKPTQLTDSGCQTDAIMPVNAHTQLNQKDAVCQTTDQPEPRQTRARSRTFKSKCSNCNVSLELVEQAKVAVREFKTMKFANSLMVEQMMQSQSKHNQELKRLEAQIADIDYWKEQYEQSSNSLDEALKTLDSCTKNVKELEDELQKKVKENEMLVMTVKEFEMLVCYDESTSGGDNA